MKILPTGRRQRLSAWVVIWAAYAAVMWFFVFPWVDSTFVSRPTFEDRPLVVPTASPTVSFSP